MWAHEERHILRRMFASVVGAIYRARYLILVPLLYALVVYCLFRATGFAKIAPAWGFISWLGVIVAMIITENDTIKIEEKTHDTTDKD